MTVEFERVYILIFLAWLPRAGGMRHAFFWFKKKVGGI